MSLFFARSSLPQAVISAAVKVRPKVHFGLQHHFLEFG